MNDPIDQMSLSDDPAVLKRIVGRHVRWRARAIGLLQKVVAQQGEGTWPEIAEFLERSTARLVESRPPFKPSEKPHE